MSFSAGVKVRLSDLRIDPPFVVATATEESKMLKRTLLALSFVVALCAAGFGMSGTAQAGHGCGYDGGYGGYGYRAYYPSSHYSYYDYGYRPRVSYYRSYDRGGYGHRGHHGHHGHHGHGHSGVSFSFGF
jgi:hypothetical protein